MAWSVSQPDEGAANASSTAYTSGSFTPGANRLLVAFIFRSNDASISGITGHDGGGSWVQVFEETGFTETNRDIEIWACFTGSSPSAGSVVVSKSGYTWRCLVNIVEIDESVNGVDMSGNVANAFGVNGVDLGGYDASPHQVSLGAFADSGNLTVVSACANAEAPSWGFEGSYTSLTINTASSSVQVAYLASEDNTVDVTGAQEQQQGIHAFEVKQASDAYPLYEDNGGIGTGTDYAVDVPYPSTVDADDILLVCLLDADNDDFDTPSGWTQIDELTTEANASYAWYWKRATGSETGSETFTSTLNAGALVAGVMARFSNCVTSGTPYDTTGGPTRNGVTQSTSATLGSVTTQGADRLVVAMIGVEDNTGVSEAANYSEIFDVTTAVGGDGEFSFQTQQVAAAGVVSSETATIGGSDYWATLVLALIPAGGAPPANAMPMAINLYRQFKK